MMMVMMKPQAVCAFQFMYKHDELKQAIYPKLWVLQSFES